VLQFILISSCPSPIQQPPRCAAADGLSTPIWPMTDYAQSGRAVALVWAMMYSLEFSSNRSDWI
jgi:hypothetical protein